MDRLIGYRKFRSGLRQKIRCHDFHRPRHSAPHTPVSGSKHSSRIFCDVLRMPIWLYSSRKVPRYINESRCARSSFLESTPSASWHKNAANNFASNPIRCISFILRSGPDFSPPWRFRDATSCRSSLFFRSSAICSFCQLRLDYKRDLEYFEQDISSTRMQM